MLNNNKYDKKKQFMFWLRLICYHEDIKINVNFLWINKFKTKATKMNVYENDYNQYKYLQFTLQNILISIVTFYCFSEKKKKNKCKIKKKTFL